MFSKILFVAASALTMQVALADNCKLEISGTDQMQFDKKELQIPASCKEVELKLTHAGKLAKNVMGHNWVLSETKNKDAVIKLAEKAGPAKDYTPVGGAVIAASKMVGGGESTTLKFSTKKLKAGGDYTFFCTMPGHASLMSGKLIVK